MHKFNKIYLSREDKHHKVKQSEKVQDYIREQKMKKIEERNQRIEEMKEQKRQLEEERRKMKEEMDAKKAEMLNKVQKLMKKNKQLSKDEFYDKVFKEEDNISKQGNKNTINDEENMNGDNDQQMVDNNNNNNNYTQEDNKQEEGKRTQELNNQKQGSGDKKDDKAFVTQNQKNYLTKDQVDKKVEVRRGELENSLYDFTIKSQAKEKALKDEMNANPSDNVKKAAYENEKKKNEETVSQMKAKNKSELDTLEKNLLEENKLI